MHVALPISSVVRGVEAPVLAVLAGTTAPLSGRRIAALAGVSHPAATRALSRLGDHGLVHVTHQPPSILYTGNRDHLAWPAIEILAGLRFATLALLRRTISEWQVKSQAAVVFGSFARADGDEDSDIDLYIIAPRYPNQLAEEKDRPVWEAQVTKLGEMVSRCTGNHLQVLDEDADTVTRRLRAEDPLLDSLSRDGIDVGEQPLREVLRQVTKASSA